MALTGRLVGIAALGLLLAPIGVTPLLLWLGLLMVAVTVDLVRAGGIAAITFERSAIPPTRLGDAAETTLRITNHGNRFCRGQLRDAWVPSAGVSPRTQPVRIAPGQSCRLTSMLTPTRRGERRAIRVTLRSVGPLGLAARQRGVVVPGSLRVLPAFTSRKFLPEKLARLRQIDGATLMRRRGQGSEFDSLREYVAGDDTRAIDWRASARSAHVVVRTWRPERDRQLILAVDTGRSSAARVGDEPRLDAVLDACLLLGAVAARAGDRVALVAADVMVRARTGFAAGSNVLPRLVTALAPLEPSLLQTDIELLLTQSLQRVPRRSLVVLFCAIDETSPDLLPAVLRLSARHQVVLASVTDPRLLQLAAQRGDSADIYTAAAAERARSRDRDTAERLAATGARVVQAGTAQFASAVCDAYLDLKAAGRL